MNCNAKGQHTANKKKSTKALLWHLGTTLRKPKHIQNENK